jgi:hypothetical protein
MLRFQLHLRQRKMLEDHMAAKKASQQGENRRDPKILDWIGNRKALKVIGDTLADLRRLDGYKVMLTTKGGFSETEAHEAIHRVPSGMWLEFAWPASGELTLSRQAARSTG